MADFPLPASIKYAPLLVSACEYFRLADGIRNSEKAIRLAADKAEVSHKLLPTGYRERESAGEMGNEPI